MQQNILELPVGSAPKNKSTSGKKAVTAPQAAQTPTSPPAASPQPQKPTTQPPPADSAGGIYNPAANRFTAPPDPAARTEADRGLAEAERIAAEQQKRQNNALAVTTRRQGAEKVHNAAVSAARTDPLFNPGAAAARNRPEAAQAPAFNPYDYSPDADLYAQVTSGSMTGQAGQMEIPEFLDYLTRRSVGGAAAGTQNMANDLGYRSYQGLPDMEAENAFQSDIANGSPEAMRYYNNLLASMDENERLAFEYAGRGDPAALYRQHLQQEAEARHKDDRPVKTADWGDRYRAVTDVRYGDPDGLLGFVGDLSESIGYMAPAMVLQAIPKYGRFLSKGYVFAAASGGAVEQALSEGATLEDALAYGTLKGSSAALEEGIFDGLGGRLGKGATDRIIEKAAVRLAKTPAGQRALSILGRIGGEGLENVLEDLWEPLAKTVYTHEQHSSVADYLSELRLSDIVYDYFLGAVMGGIFETTRTRRYDTGDVAEAVIVDDAMEAFRNTPSADTIQAMAQESSVATAETVSGRTKNDPGPLDNSSASEYNQPSYSSSGLYFAENPFDAFGHLLPNIKYVTGEYDYHYETDSLGRISRVFTETLHLTTRDKRLRNNRTVPGKLPGDDAGHLIGNRFGGSNRADNLVAQLRHMNRGAYNALERIWANAIRSGSTVSLDIRLQYDGDGVRPTGILVYQSIDGRPTKLIFKNQ